MKNVSLKVLLSIAIIIFTTGCGSPSCGEKTANQCGREIYYQLDEHIFNVEETRRAISKLRHAAKLDENAEWVNLSYSRLLLNSAYQVGDFYLKDSYNDSLLAESYKIASGVSTNSDLSQAHAHLARFQIIKGNYKKAWYTLNKAYELDNDNFYPWYLRGVISYFMRDYKKAEELFLESEKKSEFKYQRKLVTRYRQKVARKKGNYSKEEKLLQKNIRENPDNAYMYSHYAGFLKRQKRYKEAIKYYEKAIDIKPYNNAIRQLEELKKVVND